jgi:tetratricopeptide (TPR) repeat protein
MKIPFVCAAAALLALAQFSPAGAQNSYMQLKPTKYCSSRGSTDADRMIKGCYDAIDTGTLTHDQLAGAWSNIGVAYMEKKAYDKAVEALGNAIAADPTQYESYVNRAGAYDEEGKTGLAQADFDKAVALSPQHTVVYRARAELY